MLTLHHSNLYVTAFDRKHNATTLHEQIVNILSHFLTITIRYAQSPFNLVQSIPVVLTVIIKKLHVATFVSKAYADRDKIPTKVKPIKLITFHIESKSV